MRSEVVMPQMGESVTEGTVTAWLKEIGDVVERDEPLFEITTDKVDAEVPSPIAGVLVERLAKVGDTVEINTVVAVLDTEAKAGEVPAAAPESAAKAAASTVASTGAASGARTSGATATALAEAPTPSRGGVPSREELRRTRSTPLVRRIAQEHGIADLSQIDGSGLSGRVTKADIMAFIESGAHERAQGTNGSTGRIAQPSRPAPASPGLAPGERDHFEPMGPQRAAIAEHMIRSRATSAHAHTIHEIDFSAVFAARKRMKAEFEERGVKLTFTAFMVKAVADALRAFPVVNASLDGDQLLYRGDINVGVAVALEASLIVPVVRNVDELSLLGIARSINDLAERARTKRLKPDEVRGGTFTLSNHGIFGPEFGVPIINQPQTAIISTGAIKKRVVVDQKTDAIMVRPTAIFCMSFDHRTIDGATADKFLAHIRQTLEGWE
ncbi:2-oxoglutarate dehydrogenase, E2 component, dihydrolipoamide succinyltransferase [Lujinxingia litoralis]|uniref:Dihydrolipoamide acetyltransferase component of pyruvate dehydrogenase complex n=1 Tax=Lujinxingia litoralis TaxID=2211119 RepID=A0A328C175_9DELT|nr:dihydrolipoamide acetyltransferase family protein [Lujinxingia litoralis]RAL20336.1 2-oxoglutarate dehydrogenase, E2 component, dihydrolipoamide succinyltransferase [Lujinxingia litoralis]